MDIFQFLKVNYVILFTTVFNKYGYGFTSRCNHLLMSHFSLKAFTPVTIIESGVTFLKYPFKQKSPNLGGVLL